MDFAVLCAYADVSKYIHHWNQLDEESCFNCALQGFWWTHVINVANLRWAGILCSTDDQNVNYIHSPDSSSVVRMQWKTTLLYLAWYLACLLPATFTLNTGKLCSWEHCLIIGQLVTISCLKPAATSRYPTDNNIKRFTPGAIKTCHFFRLELPYFLVDFYEFPGIILFMQWLKPAIQIWYRPTAWITEQCSEEK